MLFTMFGVECGEYQKLYSTVMFNYGKVVYRLTTSKMSVMFNEKRNGLIQQ